MLEQSQVPFENARRPNETLFVVFFREEFTSPSFIFFEKLVDNFLMASWLLQKLIYMWLWNITKHEDTLNTHGLLQHIGSVSIIV